MKYSVAITAALATFLYLPSGLLAQVTVFRDVDFSGPEQRLEFTPEECMGLGNGWEDSISSMTLEDGYNCDFYWEAHCKDTDKVHITPGGTYFGAANDKFSSYRCYHV